MRHKLTAPALAAAVALMTTACGPTGQTASSAKATSGASQSSTAQDVTNATGTGTNFVLIACIKSSSSLTVVFQETTNKTTFRSMSLDLTTEQSAIDQWDEHQRGLQNSGNDYQGLSNNAQQDITGSIQGVDMSLATYSPGVRFDTCLYHDNPIRAMYFTLQSGGGFEDSVTEQNAPVMVKLIASRVP